MMSAMMFVSYLAMVVALSLLFAVPTLLLWNWLMPSLFHFATITIWEALGINMLTTILFKSPQRSKR